jgi:hypothetical protein
VREKTLISGCQLRGFSGELTRLIEGAVDEREHPWAAIVGVLKVKHGLEQVVIPHEARVQAPLRVWHSEVELQHIRDVV